jgi:hypothetical protein
MSQTNWGQAPSMGWGPPNDVKTTRVMSDILGSEKPNLVVLNGDLITGENTYLENSTRYLDIIVQPLVQRNIPWASTYGNHDHSFTLNGNDLLAEEKKYPLSMTQNMVNVRQAGTTNYVLEIKGRNNKSAMLLWFFDSKGGKEFQINGPNGNPANMPGSVDQSVITWFKNTQARLRLKHGRVLPSLAFVHIPTFASAAFQQRGVDSNRQPGINEDIPLSPQGLDDNAVYVGGDIPFMQALLGTQGLLAVFSGHDHGNDWCNRWVGTLPGMTLTGNNIILCFGRRTGYGGYGQWKRGSRQIMIYEGFTKAIDTWIRLEDGSMSGSVTLNSTYGVDKYPAVNVAFS